MSLTVTNTVLDKEAFRTVLAKSDERLLLALVDPAQGKQAAALCSIVEELRRKGTAVKLIFYGDSSALLSSPGSCGFVERWARPVLQAVVAEAEVLIPLSESSDSILADIQESGLRMPVILRTPEQVGEFFDSSFRKDGQHLLLQNDWGIGDELLLSAVAREIVRAFPQTKVWIRSRHNFRFPAYVQREPLGRGVRIVETIYQNSILYGPSAHSPYPGHLVQQMLDKVALDTGLKVEGKDLRPELEIRSAPKTRAPSIIVHSRPNPRLPSKDWGLSRWMKLVGLLKTAGMRVRQVGEASEPLLSGAEDLRGTPVNALPEIVAESWAVVSVVGFLMHLSEAARTPAVVIYGGREHPAIDGYPDQIHLSSGPLSCRGRWGCHLAPDVDCPHEMKCMEELTPELVTREVLALIGRGDPR